MNLAEINKRFVDLKRSGVDKENSSPKDGKYVFNGKKVYLKWSDYKDSSTRLNYVYKWVAYDERDDFKNFNTWKWDLDAEPVLAVDPTTEIWPEMVGKPNAEGYYRYMDMILMRVPLLKWLEKRDADSKRFDKAREQMDKKFRAEAKAEGAEVTEVELKDIRG